MFKVGDKVITSTGQVGIVTGICTCEGCESRGFYEPEIRTVIGSRIYCTDNDWRVSFRSFYQIGNQIYGNIDEDCLVYEIDKVTKQIEECQKTLEELNLQREIINELKNNS